MPIIAFQSLSFYKIFLVVRFELQGTEGVEYHGCTGRVASATGNTRHVRCTIQATKLLNRKLDPLFNLIVFAYIDLLSDDASLETGACEMFSF